MGKTSGTKKRSKPAHGSIGKSTKLKSKSYSTPAKKAKISAARIVANAATMGFLGIEKKFYDTKLADTSVGAATDCTGGEYDPSATSMISTPTQGDGEQQRDGKRIVIDSLILKGHIYNPGTASEASASLPAKVFLAVVLDTQTNGAQMNSEDCFKNLAAQASSNPEPLKNLLSGNRFRLLKSQVYDLTHSGAMVAAANFAANGLSRTFDWYIPFKGGLPVNFNAGTTASVANVVDNSIHVIAFSTNSECFIGYNARIRFQG